MSKHTRTHHARRCAAEPCRNLVPADVKRGSLCLQCKTARRRAATILQRLPAELLAESSYQGPRPPSTPALDPDDLPLGEWSR